MNLSEALDAALPEIPKVRFSRSRPPRLDPDLIVRDDVLDGEPVVGVLHRGTANFFRFTPSQWQLALLFDGVRSYEDVAAMHTAQTGALTTAADIRLFAENLDEAGLWYKTPQERNLALSEKLLAQRSRRAHRTSKINFAHISFSAWDPDRYLAWLDGRIGRFIYSEWCVLAVVLLFLFEAVVFISKWDVLGPDISLYFNFTQKSFLDIVEFWLLLLVLGFVHESAHGLTCKHYGGEVHSMGLMFLYLTPAFYVDVTESWIYATRVQRLATIIAGIWVEMVICGFAMIVWTNTQPGQLLHDFTYKIILITGLAVIVMNLNPLLKLDGYYFFTEMIGIPDLKERSTAFVSGWVQSHILRLPVETPVVPRRRLWLFVVYALASGGYSYLLLFTVIRFTFNVASHWMAASVASVPAAIFGFAIFRSRLRSLRDATNRLWSKGLGASFRWGPVGLLGAAAVLAVLFCPLWRDREDAMFVIEPLHAATLHAALAGRVEAVLVTEGEAVRTGEPLLRMTSSAAASMRSAAEAQGGAARFEAYNAQLSRNTVGVAAVKQDAAARSVDLAGEAQASLVLAAPADGVVLTSNPASLVGQNVSSGQPLLAIQGMGPSAVRVLIPASALDRIPSDAQVALMPPGRFSAVRLVLGPIQGELVHLPPGLISRQNYKGIVLPNYYYARMALPESAGDLRLGMGGIAKIYGRRRSLVQRFATLLLNLAHANFW